MSKEVKTKKITNTELLESINRSFSKVEAKLDKVEAKLDAKIDTKVEELKDKIEGVNKRIDDLSINRVKYEDHNKLKARVGFIEKKINV